MIDNDASISRNYNLLIGQTIEKLYDPTDKIITKYEYAQQFIGEIRNEFNSIFCNLQIDDLGNPFDEGTFRFTKGTSSGFSYKNLSGGEKAVFDIILDLIIAKRSYDNTIYCIDEPEAHLNTRLQAILLSVLYNLVPKNCQLILATHSIGIMRRARDIEKENPGTITFLDFEGKEFDKKQTIIPTLPDRTFWEKAYKVALDDLASLIAPETVVICEGQQPADGGKRHYSHDARCYEKIFALTRPSTKFISLGSNADVIKDRWRLSVALDQLFLGAIKIIRLIDEDRRDEEEIKRLEKLGITVLGLQNLESYLLDDEVLKKLVPKEKTDLTEKLLERKREIISNQTKEDWKQISGQIYNLCKNMLGIRSVHDNREFLREIISPLITPEMEIYKKLDKDIFGEES